MSKEYEISEALGLVWRNLPLFPSTFGPCSTDGCNGSGRECGPCIDCAEKRLAELTDEDMASEYVKRVRLIRAAENDIIDQYA